MREIKFKVWDKLRKKFAKQITTFKFDRNGNINLVVYLDKANKTQEITEQEKIYTNKFEILRFIGLKDKNGVEVYEGDIVRLHWEYPEEKPVVIKSICDVYFFELEEDKCEIIGNIFKNKELLE